MLDIDTGDTIRYCIVAARWHTYIIVQKRKMIFRFGSQLPL